MRRLKHCKPAKGDPKLYRRGPKHLESPFNADVEGTGQILFRSEIRYRQDSLPILSDLGPNALYSSIR
jgi:hypothetical protein